MLLWEKNPILPKTSFLYQELNLFQYKRSAPKPLFVIKTRNIMILFTTKITRFK